MYMAKPKISVSCFVEEAYRSDWPLLVVPPPGPDGQPWTIEGWVIALKGRRDRVVDDEPWIRKYDEAIAFHERQIQISADRLKRKRRNKREQPTDGPDYVDGATDPAE